MEDTVFVRVIQICFIFLFTFQIYAQQQSLHIATLEYPPFIYSEGDQVKGSIVEKVKEIFSTMGLDITISIYPISRGLLMVKDGKADAYFSLKKTPEREKDLLFTNVPLIRQSFVFFARNGSNIAWNGNISTIRDYRIGIVRNTSYGSIFDGYIKDGIIKNIDEADSFEINFQKLIIGRVDLIINSYDVGMYLLKKLNAENKVVAIYPPVELIDSYLAFTRSQDYSDLVKKFDSILATKND